MAKGRSKGSGKGKNKSKTSAQVSPVRAKSEVAPKAAEKMPPGVRKQLRRLEGQLANAAQQERKRVRKLERAHHRRQVAEAALEELRGVAPTRQSPATSPAPATASRSAAKPAARAAAGTSERPAAARTRASAPARPRAARPAAPPDPDKP